MSSEIEEMGPVDYLVVEFPGNKMTGEGLPLLIDLVDRGIIRVLDFAFVMKELDGSGECWSRAARQASSSTRTCGRHRSPAPCVEAAVSWWPAAGSLSRRWWQPWMHSTPRTPRSEHEKKRAEQWVDFFEAWLGPRSWPVRRRRCPTGSPAARPAAGRPRKHRPTSSSRRTRSRSTPRPLRRLPQPRPAWTWTPSWRTSRSWGELKEQGILTDAEFAEQKARILNS